MVKGFAIVYLMTLVSFLLGVGFPGGWMDLYKSFWA